MPSSRASAIPLSNGPHTHSGAQVDQIVASINEFGFTNPILAGSDGVIVAGHGREGLLRTALGMQQSPPNAVIVSLALFLTAFVMGPALQQVYDTGVRPLVANEITAEQAFQRASGPLRGFMQKNVREKDLKLFIDLSGEPPPATPEDLSLRILVPAFMISELKRAFEIGFLLFIPFVIIDMVIASILMSMGMMMLPPVMISLPFKLIFFVLVDGWGLIMGSLAASFVTS